MKRYNLLLITVLVSSCTSSQSQTANEILKKFKAHIYSTCLGTTLYEPTYDTSYRIELHKDSLFFRHGDYSNKLSLKNAYLILDTFRYEEKLFYFVEANCLSNRTDCFAFDYDKAEDPTFDYAVEFLARFYFRKPQDAEKAYVLFAQLQAKINGLDY